MMQPPQQRAAPLDLSVGRHAAAANHVRWGIRTAGQAAYGQAALGKGGSGHFGMAHMVSAARGEDGPQASSNGSIFSMKRAEWMVARRPVGAEPVHAPP